MGNNNTLGACMRNENDPSTLISPRGGYGGNYKDKKLMRLNSLNYEQ